MNVELDTEVSDGSSEFVLPKFLVDGSYERRYGLLEALESAGRGAGNHCAGRSPVIMKRKVLPSLVLNGVHHA